MIAGITDFDYYDRRDADLAEYRVTARRSQLARDLCRRAQYREGPQHACWVCCPEEPVGDEGEA